MGQERLTAGAFTSAHAVNQRIFVPEADRGLEIGDGLLWEIEKGAR